MEEGDGIKRFRTRANRITRRGLLRFGGFGLLSVMAAQCRPASHRVSGWIPTLMLAVAQIIDNCFFLSRFLTVCCCQFLSASVAPSASKATRR
jgi:hypothetical protein